MTRRSRTLSSATLAALLLGGCGSCVLAPRTCCAGDAGGAGGPAGPAAGSATKNLDEWLAYVAGEQITRRMIVRQIGEKTEGQSDAEYEQRVRETLLRRVLVGAMVWRARQFGLELKPDVLDEQIAEAAKIEEANAKERGIDMPFHEILRRRGQSLEEYKELMARDMLVRSYWRILTRGIGGKRPQLDAEPSPADCDRLYKAHRAAFDQQPGVRLAQFGGRPDDYLDQAPDYSAAVEMAKTNLRAMASEAAGGKPVDQIAAARRLKKGDYMATPAGRFNEKGTILLPALDAWAFDPARKAGDVEVFDAPRGALVSFAVLEVRPGRSRPYAEVLPDLMEMIRRVRERRFQNQHMLEVLASAPVKPPQLIDALSDQIRDEVKKLDADPVTRDIRLR